MALTDDNPLPERLELPLTPGRGQLFVRSTLSCLDLPLLYVSSSSTALPGFKRASKISIRGCRSLFHVSVVVVGGYGRRGLTG
jgi:hypothetical protein